MNQPSQLVFPNFMQVKPRIPRFIWQILRLGSLTAFIIVVWGLWHFPQQTLLIFWGIMVPLLPMVFWLLPGLWRNICPLAASNQLPRLGNFSLAKEVPAKIKRYASVIGLLLLFIAVPLRKIALNNDAELLALSLIGIISFAFIGGLLFKGKSGWCGSFCPLLPVQRLYGQTPLATVNNSHCSPCIGCTKNCFDFNPPVAYLADLYDEDPIMAGDRKFFAGMMPGLLLAYFYMPYSTEMPFYQVYLQFGIYCIVGIGVYQVMETLFKMSPQKNTAIFALVSINIFYWYASEILVTSMNSLTQINLPQELVWILRGSVLSYSLVWFWKTTVKEKLFLSQAFASSQRTKVASLKPLQRHAAGQTEFPLVEIQPSGEKLVAKPNMTLLELLEANGHPINSGCRMGACGADPVAILDGEDNMPAKSAEEEATLERLGYRSGVRMACCVKVASRISINLDPSSVPQQESEAVIEQDDSIQSIVIIGNGIAGVTAADFIRRNHKGCQIHLIGNEKYPLYNRMAISKLIYGRTALQGLILMPDDWYKKRDIQQWLNTRVKDIDVIKRVVFLATGETINYDRLIITTGSHARIPPIKNWGLNGCYTLRTAEDGMAIRSYLQEAACKRVIIAGGGLLGLEAAYAFTQVGMRVTVLERSTHLLKRQLDEKGANLLHTYLAALGITIVYQAEVDSVVGEKVVEAVVLKTGEKILANLLLVAAGIIANQDLTNKKILNADQGIIVDRHLRSSNKYIYAAGDIAELAENPGKIPGLWPVAVEQGRIAAINALGGDVEYEDKPIATGLKVVGVELTSMGEFNAAAADIDIHFKSKESYRKLVIRENKIVGSILLGFPQYSSKITAFINQKTCLTESQIQSLRDDNWKIFE